MLRKGIRFALVVAFVLAVVFPVYSQTKSKIFIDRADLQKYSEALGIERLIGNVIFRQDETRYYCDTADIDTKTNTLNAYGHVHIAFGDTLNVYADKMLYSSETKVAQLFSNVKLIDKNTVLTTDHLVYDRKTKIAYYASGGTIINQENTLVSLKGYYHTESKIFYFRKDVMLLSPESQTYSDTLVYDTNNGVATFKGPTEIEGKESKIYCEEGYYDTRNDYSRLTKRPSIFSSEQNISADSISYDNKRFYGEAFGNVEILDTLNKVIVRGEIGEMWDKKGVSYVTDSTRAITYDDKDSMFIHSDTMWMYFDKDRKAKKMQAYRNVRIFRKSMQGVCDSLTYDMQDSAIRLYIKPVLWSEKNQLTGDSIIIKVSGSRVDSLMLYNTAFMVSQDSLGAYNQIKGKNMTGYFRKNELKTIKVDGNAQTIYFIREEDGYLIGINLAEASSMLIRLKNSEISAIVYLTQAQETMYPQNEIKPEQKKLKGFLWLENQRPKNKMDIFRKTETASTEKSE
ncbi:MAG TPA: OstA-like protein [Bacteroidales bacterium]